MQVRRRLLLAIAVLIAAVIAVVLWLRRADDPATESATTPAARLPFTVGAKDPVTGAPRWFGQPGAVGRRIAGLVLGEDDAPVRGATVRIASALTMAGLAAEPSATTDDTGHFDFGPQPAAIYVVAAAMPHLTGAVQQLDLRDSTAAPPPDQLRLVLHACDASIHGTVRDTAGGVIAGALVVQGDGALSTSAGTEADDKGNYELCLPVGGAGVLVKADGYAATWDRITVFGWLRRDFELIPGTSVVGRVVRAGDRSAVAGAIVDLYEEDRREQVVPLSTSSDADGRFHFEGVPPGRHELRARADGLATSRPVEVIAEIGKPPEDVVCELAGTFTISGHVIEHEGGTPSAGTTVQMSMHRGDMRQALSAISQADGSFVIDHVFPGEYQPFTERREHDDKPIPNIKVVASDVTGIVVDVERRASIAGRILHDGKPVDGARVTTSGAFTQSAHNGSYLLRGLTPGTYRVYADSVRVGAFTSGPSVSVEKGEQRKGVDVVLDLSGSIAGVVVDQKDAPVSGVYLAFSLLHGRDFGSATTADDGSFTVRGLSGGGDYLYEVRQRDGSPLVFPPATGKRHVPVAVPDGSSHITGVRIQIRYERLTISGRVTDTAGKPVSDATIRALPDDAGRYWRPPTATTDETGAFTIRELPPGTYSVQATAARGDAREDKVAAGRSNVMMRLTELGGIEGILEGLDDVLSVAAYSMDERGARALAVVTDHSFTFRNLSAGTYRVVVRSGTETVYETVIVTPGTPVKIALHRREVGVITGIVVDAKTRAPVAGLECHSMLREGRDDSSFRSSPGPTDRAGAFRIERAPAGINRLVCNSDGVTASGETTVRVGQVARVELAATAEAARREGRVGLTLEDQLSEVIVNSVEAGGPAARAGLLVGDVLVKIDNDTVHGPAADRALMKLRYHSQDTPAKLTLERGDKQLTVLLTIEASPP